MMCRRNIAGWMVGLTLIAMASCDRDQVESEPVVQMAASNSYLECAARDLLGPGAAVIRLAEPGMCPGHFDIRPSQVQRLRGCRVMLRFDFQASLDRQVENVESLEVASVTPTGGMCEPATYLAVCKQVAEALTRVGLLARPTAESRLDEIQRRVRAREETLRKVLADSGLHDTPAIVSGRQAGFCRWLGLRVVATIGASDVASVAQVDQALSLARQAGCRLVIANRPEGTQLPESIADRLGARLVIFDNFPDIGPSQPDFDGLLEENVRRLLAGMP